MPTTTFALSTGLRLETTPNLGVTSVAISTAVATVQRVKKGIAAGRKSSDFDFEQWPGHNGGFGDPSLNHAVPAVGFTDQPANDGIAGSQKLDRA